MIVFSTIVPHTPVLIPGIGKKNELEKLKKTVEAMEKLEKDIRGADIETLVVISPHMCPEPHSFAINKSFTLKGSFSRFGLRDKMHFKNDMDLVEKIEYSCLVNDLVDEENPLFMHKRELDYGAMVPLYYLTKHVEPLVVHLSFSFTNFELHYKFGDAIGKLFTTSPRRIAVVATGDLSHRIFEKQEGEKISQGQRFDEKIIELLKKKNAERIIHFSKELEEKVDECCLPSISLLLGVLKRENYKLDILSYEAPMGIGYLVAKLV